MIKDLIKEHNLIKEDLIYEITHIFDVTQQVKKLPFVNDSREIEEIERLLENADQYLLQLKMILEEIISTQKKNRKVE